MEENLDMLSLLPDPLLFIIVSFLPFKEAVRTCILSKRWLQIWLSTKNIEFNELFFVKPHEQSHDETKRAQRNFFLNFIKNYIANHQEHVIENFSLKVSNPESCDDIIQRCINFAIRRGVKKLGLDFSSTNSFDDRVALFELPNHVYVHKSLEILKLHSCKFNVNNFRNFHDLKDVSLGFIDVSISNLQTLLSNCKMIESLSLTNCWNLEHFDMGEKLCRLRRLVIEKCHISVPCFIFKAPNLQYLKYCGVVGVYDIENVQPHVMEEADLEFPVEEFDELGFDLCKLLEDLSPVRVLTVCSYLLQAIPSGEESFRVRCDLNVRHLIMKAQMHHYELCGFMFLLNSCPLLETLILEIDTNQRIYTDYALPYPINLEKFWEQPLKVYQCLRRTLKVVEVNGFRGSMNELLALHYLISAGRALKKININVQKEEEEDGAHNNSQRVVEMRRKLASVLHNVPRASERLQISIN